MVGRFSRRPLIAGLMFAAFGAVSNRAAANDTPATPAANAATPEADGSVRTIAVEGQPVAISPDGKWLAGPGPDRDFCIWDVETLTPTCAKDRKPMPVQLETVTWAPDSSAVAFTLDSARLLVDSDIYVMETDGTLHDLTDDGPDDKLSLSSDGPKVPVDMYPAWSPDSTELAFARTAWGSDAKSTSIMTIARPGGEPMQRLVVSPQEPMIIYSPMHWLENGDIILSVLHADPSNAQNGVWRSTASGGMKRIIDGNEDATIPLPFVNDVNTEGTLATVMSFSRYGQGMNDPETPTFFVVNLESGEITPITTTDKNVHIATAGTFHKTTIVSVEMAGPDAVSLLVSNPDGTVQAQVPFPADTEAPTLVRGVTIADNGTAFLPISVSGEDKRGGILFTIAS